MFAVAGFQFISMTMAKKSERVAAPEIILYAMQWLCLSPSASNDDDDDDDDGSRVIIAKLKKKSIDATKKQ